MLRFTKKEREKLQTLIESGISLRACARSLKRHHTALLYEVKRCAGEYNADEAHQDSLQKNELRNDKLSANYLSRHDRNYVGERLDRGWSPEQIVGRAKKEKRDVPCASTIYAKYITKKSDKPTSDRSLPRKWREVRVPREWRDFGVFEVDTIKFENTDLAVMTVVEVKTKFAYMALVRLSKPIDLYFALGRYLVTYGESVKTVVIDNGHENRYLMNLVEQGFEVEVCQYGSPWQKPHVEYFNKELRDILPYDVDHSELTHQNIENICYELNHKPRKLLEFSSSYEELQKFISIA